MSKIEWTDEVWNPTTGCDRVSDGCTHCYALTMAKRLKAMGSAKYQTDGDPRTSGPGFGLAMHEDVLTLPLRWLKPRRVFVNSMSDLFHPRVTDAFLARVFAVMARAPQHSFQLLTKRPARMLSVLGYDGLRLMEAAPDDDTAQALYEQWPLPNVWVGVSVEDQQTADSRIPDLVETPAAVRWVSVEPLLGPVNLAPYLKVWQPHPGAPYERVYDLDRAGPDPRQASLLDWVVVGGETAPRARAARPMHPDWARTLRDQCTAAGVGFFFKQWGAWAPPDQFDTVGYDDVEWDQNAAVTMWPDGRVAAGLRGEFGERYETLWPAGKRHTGHRLDDVEHLDQPRLVRS